MTLGNCIYNFLLMPLQIFFEVVYNCAYRITGHPGSAIIALSLAMNFLVLPLYRRADELQEAQRNIEAKLHKGVTHIRKVFHGDERMMMLQTYYRQNHYNPVSALNGALSLLLEIPFFIAAYHFLSGLYLLSGVSFGPIADLSKPDALIVVGGMTINLLPILMTVINVISSAIFAKGYPLKTKIQLYTMAAFFLVFLYNSPSGLVFYWTLNNTFSLVKTIFYKLKNPKLILSGVSGLTGLVIISYVLLHISSVGMKWLILFVGVGLLLCLPFIFITLNKKGKLSSLSVKESYDKRLFISSALFMAILTGALIPSAVINASPQEFMNIYHFVHPLWYIVSSLLIALGTFVLWLGVFYWLAAPKAKVLFDRGVWIICGIAIVDYLFFGTDFGNLSSNLQYDGGVSFSLKQQGFNLIVIVCWTVILFLFVVKKSRWARHTMTVALMAICFMSVINVIGIRNSIAQVKVAQIRTGNTSNSNKPSFTLSKTKNNVIVIMLDRAMGEYIPYIFNEKPELRDKFDGFTYYSNVISFGGFTNFGTPALFGGYEYTPIEINRRKSELIAQKHNEALKVMPVIFDNAGFDVTVCDLPYAGRYEWIPDLSIFDDYPNINKFITIGAFSAGIIQSESAEDELVKSRNRNFFCFSIMKTSPVGIQASVYQGGRYHQLVSARMIAQIRTSSDSAYGVDKPFCDSFAVLENLPAITKVAENNKGAFLLLQNDTTHNAVLFQEPGYELSLHVDNANYDKQNMDRFTVNGRTLRVESVNQFGAYQTNMAAIIEIGKWLDYLRENRVYNNTKIILVADHGRAYNQLKELTLDDTLYDSKIEGQLADAEFYFPLLMVKDFNSTGFSVSEKFMTNADVPTIAMEDIIPNPVNPFTGKAINSNEKFAHDQFIIASLEWQTDTNNGNQFHSARWYSVHDNIWHKSNWKLEAEDAILP